jgi:hypothetical protein
VPAGQPVSTPFFFKTVNGWNQHCQGVVYLLSPQSPLLKWNGPRLWVGQPVTAIPSHIPCALREYVNCLPMTIIGPLHNRIAFRDVKFAPAGALLDALM